MAYLASLKSILFLKEFLLLLDQFYQLDLLLGYLIHVLLARYLFGNLVSRQNGHKTHISGNLVSRQNGQKLDAAI